MSVVFPTTSSLFFELSAQSYQGAYDVDQLGKSVDVAVAEGAKGKGKSKEAALLPSLFHLHTCTIENSLTVPDPTIEYWGDDIRPNPDYDAFISLREKVITSFEPFVPLTLIAPADDVLRPGTSAYRTHSSYHGTNIYLPKAHERKPLIRLDTNTTIASKEWMPSSAAWDMQNWLHAILALDPQKPSTRKATYRDEKKRFHLRPKVQICWVPDGEGPDAGAELKLLVTIDVYADMSVLYDPLPGPGPDMLGLILHSLLPTTSTPAYTSEAEARAAALRHFYACLRPAPDLPFTFSAASLQPREMSSQLLPFQIRTVRLLLEREQAGTSSNDQKSNQQDPDGFWTAFDLGEQSGRLGYRRLTGDLVTLGPHIPPKVDSKGKGRAADEGSLHDAAALSSLDKAKLPTLLDLSGVRGTMLCEEMGLGKTVEAIALLLLHRHPLSRARQVKPPERNNAVSEEQPRARKPKKTPIPMIDLQCEIPGFEDQELKKWAVEEQRAFADTSAWDATAQLHVTEVATTLIVTPPSLLKQWVSEIQRHAPSLRVCVYDGWKSLQKGYEKVHAAQVKARGAQAEAQKRRQSAQFRNQTRRKYAKTNGGKRMLTGEESEEELDDADADVKPDVAEEGTAQILQKAFVEYVRAHDVVLTTYLDLSQDLKVALPAPARSRRSTANYQLNERPRSPLVMVEWWRVIMDEVQLHGDQTDAADMVSLIPRKNSLAVSGTPAKTDIKDLMGSLKFLRVPVLPFDHRLWHRLQQPSLRPAFENLFRSLAVRTTKREVAGEFNLPHQTRVVVPIDLSEIELHYYNDTLERSRDRLHIHGDQRTLANSDWTLDRALFRICLQNLRQICTHIQVGQMQAGPGGGRGEQRLHLGRALMTMTEALEKMRNDHSQEFLIESRLQLKAMLRKAQLVCLEEDNDLRFLTASTLYEKVRSTVTRLLVPVYEHLKTLGGDQDDHNDFDRDATPDRQLTQQERERRLALQQARQTIREMSIILHQAWFFEGDVHHIRKEIDEEVNCYAQADIVRKDILARPLASSNKSVKLLQESLGGKAPVQGVHDLQTTETDNKGGLLSNDTIAQANELLKILNDNAVLVVVWREKIISLLSSPIEAAPDEDASARDNTDVVNPEAEYYAEALQAQGEVEAYLAAYAAALADRKEFMLEIRSALAVHDIRVTKQRKTQAAQNAMEDEIPADTQDEVDEKTKILMAERQAFRDARQEKGCERPLKGLLMDLNAIVHGPNRPEEIAIAKRMAAMLKKHIHDQGDYVDKLNRELDIFRKTFNRRVVYFASLQEISDSVSAPELEKDLPTEIAISTTKIAEHEVRLARMAVKGRYLQYLGTRQHDNEDIREDCIICFGSSEDDKAVLLQCGHYFCQSCYKEFRKSPGGRKCPSCRMEIDSKEITSIKLNPSRLKAPGQIEPTVAPQQSSAHPNDVVATGPAAVDEIAEESIEEQERARRVADLRKLKMMDVEKRREVMMLDMLGEYGSKINFLVKHLLYYKVKEPDARHVIFSNWSDSLNIVMQALKNNGISFISFDQGKKHKDVVDQFLNDESIKVFLLHAERESSGLTLTTCRVVHLLEPVLRHSFELQAIGRVDRLGQDKETNVYCYATMETVESRILAQGVRTGTSIYLEDKMADQAVADMPNVASAAHKGGDVTGGEEDLLGLIL